MSVVKKKKKNQFYIEYFRKFAGESKIIFVSIIFLVFVMCFKTAV